MASEEGANIVSSLTELIAVANSGNGSFVVQTNSIPAIFVDSNAKIGFNSLHPTSQLDIVNTLGNCLSLRHGSHLGPVASFQVKENGDMDINASTSSNININSSLNIINHNGSNSGLKLSGDVVEASANQLNYVKVTPGEAFESKALVLDQTKSISGVNSFSSNSLFGRIKTASQPEITSVGKLSSLEVDGVVKASGFDGTITKPAQPNITSVGTLSSLNVLGAISTGSVSGVITTESQPNIKSIGNLTGLTVNNTSIDSELEFLAGATAGVADERKVLVLGSDKTISGIEALSATSITGTLTGGPQPNITSVGTLPNLTVVNKVTAARLSGTIETVDQPNIRSIGNQPTISIAGTVIGSEVEFLAGATEGDALESKVLVLDETKSIRGITSLSANSITGVIQTSSQPNITAVGSLSSISIGGSVISSEASYLSEASPGIAEHLKVLVLSGTGSISNITSLSANQLIGEIQDNVQSRIDTLGSLTSLTVNGTSTFASTTDAISKSTGSATFSGGVGIVKSLHVGTGVHGVLKTGEQPHITSVGTLSALEIDGDLNVLGNITLNGVPVGSGGGSGTLPDFIVDVSPGNATNGKALVLSLTGSIEGITSLSASQLTGTIRTASQPHITSVGNLSSLQVKGVTVSDEIAYIAQVTPGTAAASKALVLSATSSISGINTLNATSVFGKITQASQPDITSVGELTSLKVVGGIDGTLITPSQPNITSLGNLTSLQLKGVDVTDGIGYLSQVTPGTGVASKALVLNSDNSIIGGITTLTATTLVGTIGQASQTGITSVGDLESLRVINGIEGTLITTNQPNVRSLGNLTSLLVNGTSITNELSYIAQVTPGTAVASKALVLDADGSILSGITTLTATNLSGSITQASQPGIRSVGNLDTLTVVNGINGTLITPSQPNITSLGNLTSLRVQNVTINDELSYLAGATTTPAANKVIIADALGRISNLSEIQATQFTGTKLVLNGVEFTADTLGPQNLVTADVFEATKTFFATNPTVGIPNLIAKMNSTEFYGIGSHDSVASSRNVRIGLVTAANVSTKTGAQSWIDTYPTIFSGAFTSISDHRIKENVIDLPYGLEDVNKLRPVQYKLIDSDDRHVGFIAHEVQEVIPEVVTGTKDNEDENGNPIHQSILYSNLTSLLVKAVQEQSVLIEQLRKEVDELKRK